MKDSIKTTSPSGSITTVTQLKEAIPSSHSRDWDMYESPEERENWPNIKEALAVCQEEIWPKFTRADKAAERHQKQHKIITLIAAFCGMLAVLLAIAQLAANQLGLSVEQLAHMEAVAALLAVTAVLFGIASALHHRWLLERHKAERYRLLKFEFLTDPGLWSRNEIKDCAKRLRDEVNEIDLLKPRGLHRWFEKDKIPEMPPVSNIPGLADERLGDLIKYYREKRVEFQLDYFKQKTRSNTELDHYILHAPAALFFLSVIAVFAHYILGIYTHHAPEYLLWGVGLLVLAAALPVIGASVRTWFTAFEVTRNTSRFRAKTVALRGLNMKLKKEKASESIFREFWFCEQILESEHREWLRLMIDAEWFG
jgi:hypothetical protein